MSTLRRKIINRVCWQLKPCLNFPDIFLPHTKHQHTGLPRSVLVTEHFAQKVTSFLSVSTARTPLTVLSSSISENTLCLLLANLMIKKIHAYNMEFPKYRNLGRTSKFLSRAQKKLRPALRGPVRSGTGNFYQSRLVCSPRPHQQCEKLSQVPMSSDKES